MSNTNAEAELAALRAEPVAQHQPHRGGMSDTAELFVGWREASRAKRAANRDKSAQMLTDAGIKFAAKNGGAHMIVSASDGGLIDFWPGTGKWVVRATKLEQRGVMGLIKRANGMDAK
jgi:hypothetical protein